MDFKVNLKLTLSALFFSMFLLTACEEEAAVNRDFTLSELQVISKQWCSEVLLGYGSPYNRGIDTLIKLDLTGTGYVHINTVTIPAAITPALRQSNTLSCFIASKENTMECYGVGIINLNLNQDATVLNINLIEETNQFTECTNEQLLKFR